MMRRWVLPRNGAMPTGFLIFTRERKYERISINKPRYSITSKIDWNLPCST